MSDVAPVLPRCKLYFSEGCCINESYVKRLFRELAPYCRPLNTLGINIEKLSLLTL